MDAQILTLHKFLVDFQDDVEPIVFVDYGFSWTFGVLHFVMMKSLFQIVSVTLPKNI